MAKLIISKIIERSRLKMKRFLAIVLIFCVVYSSGCSRKPKEEVAAVIDGKEVTVAMIDERIEKMPEQYRAFATKHKKEVLDEMIAEQLLYQEARKRKLNEDPDIKELMDEAVKKVLLSKLVEDETKKSIPVSDDDVKKHYQENKEHYIIPERVRASHILINSEVEARKAQEELKAGADFAEVAMRYSKDLTKDRGGDLGYFKRGQMIPEFEKVCFDLKIGEVSDLVKTRFGYHLIKLTDRKSATYRDFEDVKERVGALLSRERQKQRLDDLIKGLKDKAKVKIDDKVFAAAPAEAEATPELKED